jgi:hypothetical protein
MSTHVRSSRFRPLIKICTKWYGVMHDFLLKQGAILVAPIDEGIDRLIELGL